MGAIAQIRAMRGSMSNHERRIADYILANIEGVRSLSSKNLADQVGVSQSSVVKFSQKLGFRGYTDLKLSLTEALARTSLLPKAIHGDIAVDDQLGTVAQKLIARKTVSLNETLAVNREALLLESVNLLAEADRIVLAGVGASSLVAKDFAFKLMKLGKSVLAESDTHVQVANAATLGKGDLVFAISESGLTREVIRVAETGLKRGAEVVSLTRFSRNPLVDIARVNLYCVADEAGARSSSILARTAQHMVTDLLFILVSQRDERAKDLFERSREAVEVLRR
ncbi:SIS domain-containing protein [Microbulbifer thermotolerans]|uniref:RpiR family transcriptional regulator n=1 Tax=Microbulbifer thermotolerans TaxID=252514 RepID=A0A143HRE1_MICTH|nr:SIS domain-containing protein [Microbulbifer thermotolerans]AMX04037.1 RpiR family transcriptional regulator [Microbulbifer thermotolerans]MCX2781673.1 SIS domain-containing protein [Microbulbifer thermotolerans]MCX2793545.1 SIS domain-containing protein [Microbulbifer thermotolerans]MCX2830412.1 SIS domain-containing protein [Microbulbifer thermotolerans]MCX2840728.1 SIS domain-containing protein [Microbulbifer thermotolerans]